MNAWNDFDEYIMPNNFFVLYTFRHSEKKSGIQCPSHLQYTFQWVF